jgi:peptidoglycan/LPS O-acetylase OafA/YrhL
LWTLAVEEQFYLLLPALLSMGVNRYFNLALAVVILVPLVSIGSNLHTAPETGSLMVVGKACRYVFWKGPIMILVGSVFSLLTFKSAINSRTHFLLSFFLLLAAIAICSRTFVFYEKYVCEFVAALLIGYAIVLISSNRDLLALCLAHPVLRWVGRLSYSIYIWQEVFIGLRTWQPWLGWMSGWPLWTVVLAKLAAAFIIAVSSYYLFESKFLRVKRRFSRTKPLVSSGAPASVPLKPQQPA